MLPTYPRSVMRELARNVLTSTLRLRRGENLLVETWSGTYPWAVSAVEEAQAIGARPLLIVHDEEAFWRSVDGVPAANLGHVGSHEWAAFRQSDAAFYLFGPMDIPREEALPKPIQDRIAATDHEWFRLLEKSRTRVVRWDLGRTHESIARQFGVRVEQWRRELISAATIDSHRLQLDGERLAKPLRSGKLVHITHPNGTDLTLRLRGRTPIVDDGVISEADVRAGRNYTVVPSGVTAVAVDETFAEGTFVSNLQGLALPEGDAGIHTAGGAWTFVRGRLTKYAFQRGGEAFRRVYEKLGPGRDRPGIVSIGLNPHTTSIPLLFDQERGVICITVGRNSHQDGATKVPHFTSYLALRGGSLSVDGHELVVDGKLV